MKVAEFYFFPKSFEINDLKQKLKQFLL